MIMPILDWILIGNIKMWYRGGIGKYPIPTPHFEIKVDEETLEKSRVCTRSITMLKQVIR